MKNYDWKSGVVLLIMSVVICICLHGLTKVADRYADRHYQAKVKK